MGRSAPNSDFQPLGYDQTGLRYERSARQKRRAADAARKRKRKADKRKKRERAAAAFILAVALAVAAPAVAVVPPVALPAVPAPTSFPDQLHPVDVVAMTGQPSPDNDPCHFHPAGKQRAECWVEHAFPEREWDTAKQVMAREGGHHYHPWIENYRQFRRETGHRWTPERARYVPAEERRGWKVYGLFQHRRDYWPERAAATAQHHGWEDANLDPFDGWHNTLVAAWLAGTQGWWHWDVCAESAPSATTKFRCGPGRWLR